MMRFSLYYAGTLFICTVRKNILKKTNIPAAGKKILP